MLLAETEDGSEGKIYRIKLLDNTYHYYIIGVSISETDKIMKIRPVSDLMRALRRE